MRRVPEVGALYAVCDHYGYTPAEVRAMSTEDVLCLIARIAPANPKPLAWDQGGSGIAVGWANWMRARGTNGAKRS